MKIVLALLAVLLVSACASRPSAIAPTSVSALEYQGLFCEDTKYQLDVKRAELTALSKKQKSAATWDAVGVFPVRQKA